MSEAQIEPGLAGLFTTLNLTLGEEVHLFTTSLDIAVTRMRRQGMADEAIYQTLLRDAQTGGRIFGTFGNTVKRHIYGGIQDAGTIGKEAEFAAAGIAPGGEEKWTTYVTETGPCPDCLTRAGDVLTAEAWDAIGRPGSGWSVCKDACKCELNPVQLKTPDKVVA